ncbi:hypothetical protein RLO149_c028780 [Roseobacter litoralis Och 149]|uniref:EamA domain-containing protein n=1 Tax=Roseobacter litoralis (strain ATCC 49566 / DSM 6996 / JCM 21268 / NBRC 15278 / OCh 149) TaxID=391595 RepID=F7ZGA6_ROSLO|nr:hypothetical protein RLO149_c028780 [Roseobacter litoralis Och 149]
MRSTSLVAMYLAIYAAIPVLDLSVIAATLYTSPLFIVLLSAVFRLEAISKVHLVAVLVGFAGVLFVVQPAGAEVPEASTMGGIFLIMMAGGLVLFFDRRPTNRPLCEARLSLKADE